jgi:hypothetical protein
MAPKGRRNWRATIHRGRTCNTLARPLLESQMHSHILPASADWMAFDMMCRIINVDCPVWQASPGLWANATRLVGTRDTFPPLAAASDIDLEHQNTSSGRLRPTGDSGTRSESVSAIPSAPRALQIVSSQGLTAFSDSSEDILKYKCFEGCHWSTATSFARWVAPRCACASARFIARPTPL